MKKCVFFILALCVTGLGLKAQIAHTTINRFAGEKISGIDASGVWKIELTQGNTTSATLIFPERLKDNLVFTLENGELKIRFREELKTKSGEKFEAVIACSSLHEIDLSGACSLNGTGNFGGQEVKFDLSGASRVVIEGKVDASGVFKADLSGAAKLFCKSVSAQQFDIDLSGAAELELYGKAVNGKLEASGAAKYDLSGFQITKADVDLSGAARGKMNVTEQITGEISGAAKLFYSGGASTRVDVSGAATLKRQ